MATDASTRLQGLDPGFWEQLARTVNDLQPEGEPGTTAEELKQDYIAEAQAFEDKGVEAPEVTRSLLGASADAVTRGWWGPRTRLASRSGSGAVSHPNPPAYARIRQRRRGSYPGPWHGVGAPSRAHAG